MACLGTNIAATGAIANSTAYPRSFPRINIKPSSLNPPLRQPSRRLSDSGGRVFLVTRAEAKTMTSIEKSGIKIIKNPPESKLADLGVRSWPKMSEQAENSLSLSDFGNENINLEQQSNSNISTSQSSKKKRKAIEPRSVVWSHFTRYTKDEKPRAYCNHCKKDYAANTSVNGTSMLKNHMEGCMKNPYNNETHVTKLNQQPSSVGGGIDNRNELDKYIAEDRERNGDEFDILKWWKMNAQRFPILSQMACDIFAVPVSTVASESAFSMGGRVIDSYRSSLTPRMVQCLMCTKDWLRNEAYPINIEEDMDMLEKIDEEFGNLANETSILDI